jgi:hypothetical protein
MSDAALEYPWLKDVYATRRTFLDLATMGLLTFAAVGQIAKAPIKCKREPVYLTGADGALLMGADGALLLAPEKHYECESSLGTIGYDQHSGLEVSAKRP